MKLHILALWVCLLLLHGCFEKEDIIKYCFSDCTEIDGIFTTEDGTVPIENVQLELEWSHTHIFLSSVRKIATAQTNKNGYYRMAFRAKDVELTRGSYTVTFHVPGDDYMDLIRNEFELHGIDRRDTTVTQNYHIPTRGANIHVRITNPDAIPDGDKLICNVTYKVGDLDKDVRMQRSLNSLDTSEAIIPTAALQYTYLRVIREENDEASFYLDSMILDVGETRSYEISF